MRLTHTLLALALVPACGSSQASSSPIYPGRSDGEPSMECLPDADITEAAYTAHMLRGRDLARASFEVPDPAFPADRTASTLSAWAAGPLRTWIEQKTHSVDAARQELDLAAEENHRQRIMGGAIVGLMHEDIGRIISRMPIPDDLANEPEILEAFEHVIQGQATPYFRLARQAYRACSLNAVSPESMQHWSHFCRARMDNLPDDGSEESTPDGTTVEVTHD
jgi:hypothetical protein